MPLVYENTKGTAIIKLKIPRNDEGIFEKLLKGCFVKRDANLDKFVQEHIEPSADSNKYESSEYLVYSPVSDYQEGEVTEAVIIYEKISKKLNVPIQKERICRVKNPLIITFNGHLFLCCDHEDLNKNEFLEECRKKVRINQTLDPRKSFYGLGMEDNYLKFISFKMRQSQNYVYEINDSTVFNKLLSAGPLLLDDKKAIVGCYRKTTHGNCRIEIDLFEKSQGYPSLIPPARHRETSLPPPGSSERDGATSLPPPGSSERDGATSLPPPGPSERDGATSLPPPGTSDRDEATSLPPPGPSERDGATSLPPPGTSDRDEATSLPPPDTSERDGAKSLPPPDSNGRNRPPSPPPPDSSAECQQLEHQDKKTTLKFNQLMLETTRHLQDYIERQKGTLDELVDHFRGGLLPDEQRRRVSNIKELLEVLAEEGVIRANDVTLLKMLAEALKLVGLIEEINEFETYRSGDLLVPDPQSPGHPAEDPVLDSSLHGPSRDPIATFLYNHLLVETTRQLEAYITLPGGSGNLGELKDFFVRILPEKERTRARNVKELVKALDEQGLFGANNLKLLNALATKLKLQKLIEEIQEFQACSETPTNPQHTVGCKGDFSKVNSGVLMHATQTQTREGLPLSRLEKQEKIIRRIKPVSTGWAFPKKENLNFALLCRLTIDAGTRVLRDVFDKIHPPRSLRTTLLSTRVHATLKGLRAKRILTTQQWDKLYPASTPVTSEDFDITLLFVLLRNICGLTPPATGWDKPPAATDLSRDADLARVKYYRNELYSHATETSVSDSDFVKYWKEISDVLVRLGGPHYEPLIESLKIDAMDPEEEANFVEALKEWEEIERTLLQKMEEVLKVVKGCSDVKASQTKGWLE